MTHSVNLVLRWHMAKWLHSSPSYVSVSALALSQSVTVLAERFWWRLALVALLTQNAVKCWNTADELTGTRTMRRIMLSWCRTDVCDVLKLTSQYWLEHQGGGGAQNWRVKELLTLSQLRSYASILYFLHYPDNIFTELHQTTLTVWCYHIYFTSIIPLMMIC